MMVRRSMQQPLREALCAAELAACDAGYLPPRYARNGRLTTPAQQAMLLRARVLLVGLGGLGGHVLDGLCRMGVGHITGVDGDSFEHSNLNRQLLCTNETIGQPKAQAAQMHARLVNTAVEFVPVAEFVRGAAWQSLVTGALRPQESGPQEARAQGALQARGDETRENAAQENGPQGHVAQSCAAKPTRAFDVVVDALGGLDDRPALHAAARQAGITVVTAGIAGLTGWVQVAQPDTVGAVRYFSQAEPPVPLFAPQGAGLDPRSGAKGATPRCSPSAEELLGNLAPTVLVAAGMQCAHVYTVLTGGIPDTRMLIFDLQDAFFQRVDL